jgi:pyruvate,orthophosphate dikinase
MNASPGARSARLVFDSAPAGPSGPSAATDVILVRRRTNPTTCRAWSLATGILTSRGGKTSHAPVVARAMGSTCVLRRGALA